MSNKLPLIENPLNPKEKGALKAPLFFVIYMFF